MSDNQKNNKSLYLILIGLLLLVNLVGLYFFLNKSKENTVLQEENTKVNTELTDVKLMYEDTKNVLEEQKGINTALDSVINVRQKEVASKKAQIEKILKKSNLSAAELATARTMIQELKTKNDGYLEEIETYKTEILGLKKDKEELTENLNKEKKTTEELESAKSKLEEKNKYLANKFDLGALLQTNGLKAYGIKVKSADKEVEMNKIKKMTHLKVTYNTGVNQVIEKGNVVHHIRIIGPGGTTITNGESGLTKLSDGTELQFSKKVDIDYSNQEKTVNVLWSGNAFSPGKHTVEVYQSGHKVGSTTVELK
jgi:predicted RNase H-like nuclease (RuvC/YqgF family)